MSGTNKGIGVVVEALWLIFAAVSLILGVYHTSVNGIGKSYMMFVVCAISLVMFFLRRFIRLKGKNK